MKVTSFLFTAVLLIFFTGCATKNNDIYYWNGAYEAVIYKYLNNEQDFVKQIGAMEEIAQHISKTNKKAPPGFHAHLALLYMNQGDMVQADKNFNEEIKNFPESSQYINFLRSNKNKGTMK